MEMPGSTSSLVRSKYSLSSPFLFIDILSLNIFIIWRKILPSFCNILNSDDLCWWWFLPEQQCPWFNLCSPGGTTTLSTAMFWSVVRAQEFSKERVLSIILPKSYCPANISSPRGEELSEQLYRILTCRSVVRTSVHHSSSDYWTFFLSLRLCIVLLPGTWPEGQFVFL